MKIKKMVTSFYNYKTKLQMTKNPKLDGYIK
jgi:hypothetical protein